MKKFRAVVQQEKQALPPVELSVTGHVHFIGPASSENPMLHARTLLRGEVRFHDSKIKWSSITLQFIGKAGINLSLASPTVNLQQNPGLQSLGNLDNGNGVTHIESTVSICNVEKELIFGGESVIDFGLHLPPHLPPSIRAKHAFVEYTLIAHLSTGSFLKKQRLRCNVMVMRHYLPNPSVMIPSVEHHGVDNWLEWWAEVPKAVAIEAGEVVVALRWSAEKERVAVAMVEIALEELECYRFTSPKNGVCALPPVVNRFPAHTYHPPHSSSSSDTHFIRFPFASRLQTHHFDPFLEIKHQICLTIHFAATDDCRTTPFTRQYPIIITDYPTSPLHVISPGDSSPLQSPSLSSGIVAGVGADEPAPIEFDLPEYTPQYQEIDPNTGGNQSE